MPPQARGAVAGEGWQARITAHFASAVRADPPRVSGLALRAHAAATGPSGRLEGAAAAFRPLRVPCRPPGRLARAGRVAGAAGRPPPRRPGTPACIGATVLCPRTEGQSWGRCVRGSRLRCQRALTSLFRPLFQAAWEQWCSEKRRERQKQPPSRDEEQGSDAASRDGGEETVRCGCNAYPPHSACHIDRAWLSAHHWQQRRNSAAFEAWRARKRKEDLRRRRAQESVERADREQLEAFLRARARAWRQAQRGRRRSAVTRPDSAPALQRKLQRVLKSPLARCAWGLRAPRYSGDKGAQGLTRFRPATGLCPPNPAQASPARSPPSVRAAWPCWEGAMRWGSHGAKLPPGVCREECGRGLRRFPPNASPFRLGALPLARSHHSTLPSLCSDPFICQGHYPGMHRRGERQGNRSPHNRDGFSGARRTTAPHRSSFREVKQAPSQRRGEIWPAVAIRGPEEELKRAIGRGQAAAAAIPTSECDSRHLPPAGKARRPGLLAGAETRQFTVLTAGGEQRGARQEPLSAQRKAAAALRSQVAACSGPGGAGAVGERRVGLSWAVCGPLLPTTRPGIGRGHMYARTSRRAATIHALGRRYGGPSAPSRAAPPRARLAGGGISGAPTK